MLAACIGAAIYLFRKREKQFPEEEGREPTNTPESEDYSLPITTERWASPRSTATLNTNTTDQTSPSSTELQNGVKQQTSSVNNEQLQTELITESSSQQETAAS